MRLPPNRAEALYLGIDFGTSGCRASVIDSAGVEVAVATVAGTDSAATEVPATQWWAQLIQLLQQIPAAIRQQLVALAIDGTSGSVVACDAAGVPLAPALLYHDNRATAAAAQLAAIAPAESAAHGTGSALAKLLWLRQRIPTIARVESQAGWLLGRLGAQFGYCDRNSALKLGWDAVAGCWPDWMAPLQLQSLLPTVVAPGTPLGLIDPTLAATLDLPPTLQRVAGTTDSTAAIIASGASQPGEAVTSLGSTLVLKMISERPVSAPNYGIYSQPYGDYWLVGGSSNSGGAVLRHYFSDAALARLTPQLQPQQPTGLDYYPLLQPGERFPIADPTLAPRLTPRPTDAVRWLQGLLEGIAAIERLGYTRLAALGAGWPTSIRSCGGGANNRAWTVIRERLLGVPLKPAQQQQAAYGSALLARHPLLTQPNRR